MVDEQEITEFFDMIEEFKRAHPDLERAREICEQHHEIQRVYDAVRPRPQYREWIDNKTGGAPW